MSSLRYEIKTTDRNTRKNPNKTELPAFDTLPLGIDAILDTIFFRSEHINRTVISDLVMSRIDLNTVVITTLKTFQSPFTVCVFSRHPQKTIQPCSQASGNVSFGYDFLAVFEKEELVMIGDWALKNYYNTGPFFSTASKEVVENQREYALGNCFTDREPNASSLYNMMIRFGCFDMAPKSQLALYADVTPVSLDFVELIIDGVIVVGADEIKRYFHPHELEHVMKTFNNEYGKVLAKKGTLEILISNTGQPTVTLKEPSTGLLATDFQAINKGSMRIRNFVTSSLDTDKFFLSLSELFRETSSDVIGIHGITFKEGVFPTMKVLFSRRLDNLVEATEITYPLGVHRTGFKVVLDDTVLTDPRELPYPFNAKALGSLQWLGNNVNDIGIVITENVSSEQPAHYREQGITSVIKVFSEWTTPVKETSDEATAQTNDRAGPTSLGGKGDVLTTHSLDDVNVGKTIARFVIGDVHEQERNIALFNCLVAWDEVMDLDVIIQGIHDRYIALGKPQETLKAERRDLHYVCIVNGEGEDLIHFNNYPSGGTRLVIECLHQNFFHQEELQTMAEWLLPNFFHRAE